MAYPSVEHTLALVSSFDAANERRAEESKRETRRLLERCPAPFDRTSYAPGHITASAVVIAPDRRHILLVYHNKLGKWLQPGGHCEQSDWDVRSTAKREVLEETGVSFEDASDWALVGIDVHEIPETETEPLHRHHDLCFAGIATPCQVSAVEAVATAVWCAIADLDRYRVDRPLRSCFARALHVTL